MQYQMIKKILLPVLAVMLCLYGMAQVKPKVVGLGKVKPNGISLRWNVSDYRLFQQLVTQGVLIDREETDTANKPIGPWKRVTPDTIKAMPLALFSQPENIKDTGKIIIAQCIYGKPSAIQGSLIEKLKKQDEETENKYAILALYTALKPAWAKTAGLGFDDALQPDTLKNYLYRVIPCTRAGYARIDTGYIMVKGIDLFYEQSLQLPYAEGFDKKILLHWPAAQNLFAAYYIARSSDTGRTKNYSFITSQPLLPKTDSLGGVLVYTFADSVANNHDFYYKIFGVTPFGDTVSAGYPVIARARDLTPPKPVQLSFKLTEKHVVFNWKKSVDGDLRAIYLTEGKAMNKIDTVFTSTPLKPSVVTYAIDMDEKKMSSGYFRLALVDSNGNYSYSNHVYVFLPDKTPPNKPYGLKGSIDSLGQVQITWMPDSLEALRGYKILMSNDAEHFVNLTDALQDTAYNYSTTMATLSKDIYFEVVAIDGSFNHSEPSDILHLKRPLKLKPLRPVFIDMKAGISGVELKWSESHSEDFAYFAIYRRNTGEAKWGLLSKATSAYFKDTAVLPEHRYEYGVQEVSKQNFFSDTAFPVLAIIGKTTPVSDIQLKLNRNNEQKKYILNWVKPAKTVSFYLMYKDSGSGLTMYRSVAGTELMFSDNIDGDKEYHYGVEIHYADHTVSDIINAQ